MGPAPLARSRVHIESEEGVPDAFGEIRTGQPVHGDAAGQRLVAFTADGLALARGERRQECIEAPVIFVVPVELTMRTLQIAARSEKAPFRFGRERHMHRGGLAA